MSYYTINLPVFQSQSRILCKERYRKVQANINGKKKPPAKASGFWGITTKPMHTALFFKIEPGCFVFG